MTLVTRLDEVHAHQGTFHVVAAIVGVEGPKRVYTANGTSPVVLTLSLSDGSLNEDVELSLWETDCARASSLRMLDVVLVRDALFKTNAQPTAGSTHSLRISLFGPSACVRLIPDNIEGQEDANDQISQAAVGVMRWRDERFSLLVTMRQRGAVWTRDEARHSDRPRLLRTPSASHPGSPSPINPTCAAVATAAQHSADRSNEARSRATLQDVCSGLVTGCAEVSDVTVRGIYIRAEGMRVMSERSTGHMLRDGCWYACIVCDKRAAEKNDMTICEKCGGDVKWRFGKFVFRLEDKSTTAFAYMTEDDVRSLLFAIDADTIRRDENIAKLAATILDGLLNDTSRFIALVAKEAYGVNGDVRIRRLLV